MMRGFYIPAAYAEFAKSVEEQSLVLTEETPGKLNRNLGLTSSGSATR